MGAADRHPAQRLDDDHRGGDVDADVGDVEDRPVRQSDEVHHVSAQHPGGPEDPVGEVAEDSCEQEPQPDGPAHAARAAGHPQHDDRRGDRQHTEHQRVRRTGAEGRSRIAGEVQRQEVADERLRRLTGQVSDRPDLAEEVRDVPEHSDAREDHQDSGTRTPRVGLVRRWNCRVAGVQRRSSRCLHDRHSVARGKAINRILPIGCPQLSHTPYVASSMRARACSVCASMTRALFARLISWSRSNVVEPTSAWSLPAPSPASSMRSCSSCSARFSSERSRSRSALISPRTSSSSATVQGFSSALTARFLAWAAAEGVLVAADAAGVFFTDAFLDGAGRALPAVLLVVGTTDCCAAPFVEDFVIALGGEILPADAVLEVTFAAPVFPGAAGRGGLVVVLAVLVGGVLVPEVCFPVGAFLAGAFWFVVIWAAGFWFVVFRADVFWAVVFRTDVFCAVVFWAGGFAAAALAG